jgi:hypothetical protein
MGLTVAFWAAELPAVEGGEEQAVALVVEEISHPSRFRACR